MSSLRSTVSAALAVAALAAGAWAHLPTMYDASLVMGRTGHTHFDGTGSSLAAPAPAAVTFSNKGEWNATTVYNGDYSTHQGDTVSCGEFNGKKLWWWAKFYASGEGFKPGYFAPQGGTSPWVLINSLSAVASGRAVAADCKGTRGRFRLGIPGPAT